MPRAQVMLATAMRGSLVPDSTISAAAGPRKATVCSTLRTWVTLQPRCMSPSASTPATLLPTAMTVQGRKERKLEERRFTPRVRTKKVGIQAR